MLNREGHKGSYEETMKQVHTHFLSFWPAMTSSGYETGGDMRVPRGEGCSPESKPKIREVYILVELCAVRRRAGDFDWGAAVWTGHPRKGG